MSAGIYDITIDQGSDFKLTLVIKDGDNPRNLTGYTARGHLRTSMDTATYFPFDFTDSTYDSNGTLIMKLPFNAPDNHGHTGHLTDGNYFYDVEIYKGSEGSETEVERILQGKAKVTREVTR